MSTATALLAARVFNVCVNTRAYYLRLALRSRFLLFTASSSEASSTSLPSSPSSAIPSSIGLLFLLFLDFFGFINVSEKLNCASMKELVSNSRVALSGEAWSRCTAADEGADTGATLVRVAPRKSKVTSEVPCSMAGDSRPLPAPPSGCGKARADAGGSAAGVATSSLAMGWGAVLGASIFLTPRDEAVVGIGVKSSSRKSMLKALWRLVRRRRRVSLMNSRISLRRCRRASLAGRVAIREAAPLTTVGLSGTPRDEIIVVLVGAVSTGWLVEAAALVAPVSSAAAVGKAVLSAAVVAGGDDCEGGMMDSGISSPLCVDICVYMVKSASVYLWLYENSAGRRFVATNGTAQRRSHTF